MFEDYKEANAVALYDSQTLIVKKGFEHAFHEFSISKTVIDIDTLHDIARCFNFYIDKDHLEKLDSFELFYKNTYYYLEDAPSGTIENILIKTDGQFLSIVTVENWDGEIVNREILYSGKFSIDFGEVKTAK